MLYMGTSGFSYDDWVGHFYPPGLPKREWLVYYAREFNTCEVNSTYYAIPRPSNLKAMAEKTGDDFQFVIKANKEMTHQREDNAEVFRNFCAHWKDPESPYSTHELQEITGHWDEIETRMTCARCRQCVRWDSGNRDFRCRCGTVVIERVD